MRIFAHATQTCAPDAIDQRAPSFPLSMTSVEASAILARLHACVCETEGSCPRMKNSPSSSSSKRPKAERPCLQYHCGVTGRLRYTTFCWQGGEWGQTRKMCCKMMRNTEQLLHSTSPVSKLPAGLRINVYFFGEGGISSRGATTSINHNTIK
jgi:hypothetical protein